MDGWMDGWMDERTDGRSDQQLIKNWMTYIILHKYIFIPVGFATPPPPHLRQCIAVFAVSEGGCCSISHDFFVLTNISFSYIFAKESSVHSCVHLSFYLSICLSILLIYPLVRLIRRSIHQYWQNSEGMGVAPLFLSENFTQKCHF